MLWQTKEHASCKAQISGVKEDTVMWALGTMLWMEDGSTGIQANKQARVYENYPSTTDSPRYMNDPWFRVLILIYWK